MKRTQTIASVAVVIGLALVVAKGCALRPDLEVSRKFQEAQAIFDEASSPEDFLHAAAVYQEILDSGMRSGAVLFNQGNALMRAGQPGRAIAAYRQAQRYRPGDPYLEANLQYALGNVADEAGRSRPLFEYVLFWQDWISYAGKFRLLGAAALATFLLACGGLFVSSRLPSRLAIVGLVVTVILAVSAAYDWNRFDRVQHGVIVADHVVARKGNNESYKPAFTQPLEDGTEFSVLERRGDWIQIRLPGNQDGWIEDSAAVVY
ncbi:MAG: tetratricopeptide repeat protein [Pirellulales bacterium]|nr:tetratricopeptide repeat protein [Pirellulales bacterium]